ncbi:MAG: hypothetical protein Q4G68_13260 [Planctomycetia bacterium]|nr:hypothetical protein [Planctomycetia bacterium]
MLIISYETGPFDNSIVYKNQGECFVFSYPETESRESALKRLTLAVKSEEKAQATSAPVRKNVPPVVEKRTPNIKKPSPRKGNEEPVVHSEEVRKEDASDD